MYIRVKRRVTNHIILYYMNLYFGLKQDILIGVIYFIIKGVKSMINLRIFTIFVGKGTY
jgi:hypothetical protein